MSATGGVDLGYPAILAFRGPDAVRYLNGQVTQDVRKVVGQGVSLASCVTDAKGKLQFFVEITEGSEGELWVIGRPEHREELEARLTRYLIADEVDVEDLTGKFRGWHVMATETSWPRDSVVRQSTRLGTPGEDGWIPEAVDFSLPAEVNLLADDALNALRIHRMIPQWGQELLPGMLPPEARLEASAISYQKGCYIGQEVISRIKSAGKVNRYLHGFQVTGLGPLPSTPLNLLRADGRTVGEITSLSPIASDGVVEALGYLRRGEDAQSWALEGLPEAVVTSR